MLCLFQVYSKVIQIHMCACTYTYTHPSQFSSVAQLCPTLCDPMDCSRHASLSIPTPGVYSDSCPLSR